MFVRLLITSVLKFTQDKLLVTVRVFGKNGILMKLPFVACVQTLGSNGNNPFNCT